MLIAMSDGYLEWNENRQNHLKSLLDELINAGIESDENGLDSVKDGFKSLYLEKYEGLNFRHKYSTLTEYVRKQRDEDLDVLMTNLRIVMKRCDDEALIEKLLKLEDHLSLEISRIASYKQLEESRNTAIELKNGLDAVGSRISKADGDLNDIHENISKVTEDLEDIKSESSKNNIRLVTVLGMFSAIVLTFTGGMAFLSGSLSGIQDVDVLKLTFFILLCGFILYNLILLLLSVIERAVGFDLVTSNRGYKWMVIIVNAMMLAPMAMIALHWSRLLAFRKKLDFSRYARANPCTPRRAPAPSPWVCASKA